MSHNPFVIPGPSDEDLIIPDKGRASAIDLQPRGMQLPQTQLVWVSLTETGCSRKDLAWASGDPARSLRSATAQLRDLGQVARVSLTSPSIELKGRREQTTSVVSSGSNNLLRSSACPGPSRGNEYGKWNRGLSTD